MKAAGIEGMCHMAGPPPPPPELSLHPAQVSPSRELQGPSFENQPVLGALLARIAPAEARVWPRALSGSFGQAAPCWAQACLEPVPQSWQPRPGVYIVATVSPDLRSRALAGEQQPQDREGNHVQGPPFPRIGAPSCPLSIPLWDPALPWLLGSRGQAWLQAASAQPAPWAGGGRLGPATQGQGPARTLRLHL